MKSKFSARNPETLAAEIAALARASRADLTSRWRALYNTQPPRRISREVLKRAIAYRLQELALGGLKPATRRLLAKVAADASAALTPAPTQSQRPQVQISSAHLDGGHRTNDLRRSDPARAASAESVDSAPVSARKVRP